MWLWVNVGRGIYFFWCINDFFVEVLLLESAPKFLFWSYKGEGVLTNYWPLPLWLFGRIRRSRGRYSWVFLGLASGSFGSGGFLCFGDLLSNLFFKVMGKSSCRWSGSGLRFSCDKGWSYRRSWSYRCSRCSSGGGGLISGFFCLGGLGSICFW